MSRVRESAHEERRMLQFEAVGRAIESIEVTAHSLPGEVVLTGFSVRLGGDCLITLRAVVAREKAVIGFIGGATMGAAVLKADQMLRGGLVEWRADRFAK